MKRKKILKVLDLKQRQLNVVYEMQEFETKKSTLKDLDKNEIEIKAQISILRHLLYNQKS